MTSIDEALTLLQDRPETMAIRPYYDRNAPGTLTGIDWRWQGYPELDGGTLKADPTTHRVSMISAGFPGGLSLEEVIQAYSEPSHVFAEGYRATDTPDIVLKLEVVWLEQGLALSWIRSDFTFDTSLDAIDYHPVFFPPTLDGYATALRGYPIDSARLTPWHGVKSFGDYCSNCASLTTPTP